MPVRLPFLPLLFAAASSAAMPAAAQPVAPPVIPPGRVGRIAAVSGSVSFHGAGAIQWQLATLNLPVTTGTALWVAPGGEAALGVADNRATLAPSSELDLDQLDDQALVATQPAGESYWHLRTVLPADTYSLRTPRGVVTIASAGRYAINSGDMEHPTTVTVLDGAATVAGGPASQEVGAGQTLTIEGNGAAIPFTASIGPAVTDDFLRHVLAEEAPPRPHAPLAPAILAEMTGAEPLYDTGEWVDNADYGPVWYPPAVGYVPYRQGRWAFVAPWGWTWVDSAPWGFAPSHYGRWALFENRWGWVPGREWGAGRLPVYAPALVGFLGGAAFGAAARGPLVGWAPLGPRDAYRPSYPIDERRLQILNGPTNATTVINTVNNIAVGNRSAVTIVPRQVVTNSLPVAAAWHGNPVPPGAAAAPVLFQPQAVPTRATIGATNAALQRINPAGLSAPATHVGPGPSFSPGFGPGFNRLPQPGVAATPALREREARPPGLPGPVGPVGLVGPGVGPIAPPQHAALPRVLGDPGGAQRPEEYSRPRFAAPRPDLPRVRYGGPPPGAPQRLPDVRYGGPSGRREAVPGVQRAIGAPGGPGGFRPQPAFARPQPAFARPQPPARPAGPPPHDGGGQHHGR